MSLKVYFDNNLIDEEYYSALNNNNELFNESFKLGSTPCNKFTLNIRKEGVTQQPKTIQLYDETTQFADLKIDNIEEQDYEYVYTLTDRMMDLNFNYDASEIFENGHTTLYNIVLDICDKVGLILGTNYFRSYDKEITWYDNTRTAREYIGFIAELNGGFARIENNTLYFIKQKTNSVKTIDIDDCEDFKIGERHLITRVVYELGAVKYEFGNETGNTLYLNSDNVYITSESEVEGIYNDINGFEFYSYTTNNCPIDYDIKVGDVITFTDGENEYPTIAQYDLEYFGGWYGGYDLEINTERQEETQIIGDKQNIKNLRIIVDRDANRITQVVEEVGEQNQKIAQVTSEINQTAQNINLSVDQKLTNYSTTTQMNSAINVKADEISSVVSTKVGEDEVISKINQSSEAVSINANKVNLSGKNINLTGDNITISSTNFNVDKNGNISCKNASITGGNIRLGDSGSSGGLMQIYDNNDANTYSRLSSWGPYLYFKNSQLFYPTHVLNAYDSNYGAIAFNFVDTNNSRTYIDPTEIRTPIVYQTSKEEDKKDFEKYINALETIKDIDIYKYHLKNENEEDKKHIGFVIGKDFKYRKEVTSKNNDGVDIYSFVSLCCQAIKEQQQKIEELEKRLEEK